MEEDIFVEKSQFSQAHTSQDSKNKNKYFKRNSQRSFRKKNS